MKAQQLSLQRSWPQPPPKVVYYPQKRNPISKTNKTRNLPKKHGPCLRIFFAFWDYFKIYLSYCNLHGFSFLVKKELSLWEKLLWSIILLVSMVFCLYIAFQSWDHFQHKSTVMGVERNYHYWNNSLPALTVCPMKRLNDSLFEKYCNQHKIMDPKVRQEFGDFLESLANSTYFNFENIVEFPSIDSTLKSLGIRSENYMELIFNLTGNLLYFDKDLACREGKNNLEIRQVLTEYGLCYMANTKLSLKISSDYYIFGRYPPYNDLRRNYVKILKANFFNPSVSLQFFGFPQAGIDNYVHSGHDVPRVDSNFGKLKSIEISAKVMDIITEDNVEVETTVEQRRCRFNHESNLKHFPIYTRNLCFQECRLNLAMEYCHCIPHFYPNSVAAPKPVCDYKTLKKCFPPLKYALLKLYRIKEGDVKEFAQCDCLQNCEDTVVTVTSYLIFSLYNSETSKAFPGYGASLLIDQWPTERLKLQVVYTFTDFLVSIGGTAGLLLGFSVLSAIEILYFFTLRLLFHLCGYKLE